MRTDYEYIILGLGGIGAGAAYWLAREAGEDVLGLEQFEIGHVRGGSQDHSRIIRLSYHTKGYVELAKEAYQAWAALEEDAGQSLIVKTGGLDLTHPGARIRISDYTESMDAAGVPYERLDAEELMRRWPQWKVPDDVSALYQPESGIAPAAKCNAAHLRLARAYGATLRENAGVAELRDVGGEIEVVADGVTYRGRKLVIAAGAWTNNLLAHFGRELPLTVTQEQVVYYDTPHAAEFAPERFPIWIWMDVPCFYGFPVYGEAGPKVSEDVGGEEVTAETRTFEPNPDIQSRMDAFVRKHLPRAYGPPITIKTCLYTMPPDRDFVLDTLPDHPNVSVAVGAAQGFKFASLLGKILSELAATGETAYDIEPFRVDRPRLLEENPRKTFMV
ncbi:MAG: N-methyl-L-tryptophan oxidase [Chloroflexota bacterium]